MLRNKKKPSKKKKLAPGGMLQQQGQGQPQGPDLQMQVAGALPGPWGALAKLNVTGGRAIRGDGTSAGRNIAGGLADGPSRYFNALQSGNLKEAIPIVGDIATTKRMINQKNQANVGVESEFLSGALKNAGNSLAKGGRLNKISKDAVEVRANNPSQTDSVEIPQAFVDHNEIIDNQNRVFSDDLLAPSGKSIAKTAKKLEKMKDKRGRFTEANARIDGKLDQLFDYQEGMKDEASKLKMRKGGKLTLARGGNPMTDLNIFSEGPVNESLQSMYSKSPSLNSNTMAPIKDWSMPLGEVAGGGPMLNQNNKATNSFDWNKGITGLATFAPNAVSGLLQRRLKGPRSPLLEMQSSLKRLSAEPQVASATRAYNQAEKTIRNNTSNAADLMSGTGSLLAKRFSNENQIRGQVNQLNAQIGNQEAYLNQGVKARNTERTNAYRNDSVDFANRKLQMTSENVANLSGKILQRGKERNQMERDSQALDYLESAYGDSGVLTRLAKEDPELYNRVKKSLGKSKGGKLNKLSISTKKKK